MDNKSNNNSDTTSKKWGKMLIGILTIQAILEFFIGAALLFNFPETVQTGFGITYHSELHILGVALGLYLFLLTTLLILGIVWTRNGNRSGITIAVVTGAFLFTFGIVSYLKIGDIQGIWVDSMRGLITIGIAFMAGKELQNGKVK